MSPAEGVQMALDAEANPIQDRELIRLLASKAGMLGRNAQTTIDGAPPRSITFQVGQPPIRL